MTARPAATGERRANLPLLVASAASVGLGLSGMSVLLLGVFADRSRPATRSTTLPASAIAPALSMRS